MKIKVYQIFFDDELQCMFITKRSVKKYLEYLEFYETNNYMKIRCQRGFIYV